MERRTYKRSTLFCVKKRADEIWERGENPHRRQCALLPLSLPPRRGTIPIIARALTTSGYHHVRKPPPLYIPVGSPRRPQPPGTANLRRHTYPKVLRTSPNSRGTAELRQHPPYVPEGSQNQPQRRGHRGVAPTTALSNRRFSPCDLLRRRENRRFISSVCETEWRVPRSGTTLHI
jgi:hypothetical protein